MNRLQLADEFLKAMYMLKKTRPQKRINEAIHGEVLTLRFIHVHGGNVLPSEISGEINVSTARIAASLNRLEKKGLITRQIDTSDRRRILVNLTDEGMALAARREGGRPLAPCRLTAWMQRARARGKGPGALLSPPAMRKKPACCSLLWTARSSAWGAFFAPCRTAPRALPP